MRKSRQRLQQTPYDLIAEELSALKAEVRRLSNNRGPTVPIYDPDNFPSQNVLGQVALAHPSSTQPKTAWAYDEDNGWWKIGAAANGVGHIDLNLLIANGSDTVGIGVAQSFPGPGSSDTVSSHCTCVIKALDTAWNFTLPVLNNSPVSISSDTDPQLSVQDLSLSTIALYSCTMPTIASGAANYISVDSLLSGTATLDISSSLNPIFLAAHIYAVTVVISIKKTP